MPELEIMFEKYNSPKEYDKIVELENKVEETKETILNSIDSVLERGESIDDLIIKTEDLSMASKKFIRTTKKMNRCCIIS